MEEIADAIMQSLSSPNEYDRNGEQANIVDALFAISRSIRYLAHVIEQTTNKTGEDIEDGD